MLFCSLVYKNMGGFLQQKAYSQLRAHSLLLFSNRVWSTMIPALLCNSCTGYRFLMWCSEQLQQKTSNDKKLFVELEGVRSSVAWTADFTEQADAVATRRARCVDPVTDSRRVQSLPNLDFSGCYETWKSTKWTGKLPTMQSTMIVIFERFNF